MNQSDPPATTTAKSPTAELTPVVSALREGLGDDLVALVLFGSRARGDHYPQSDWDLLLIAPDQSIPATFISEKDAAGSMAWTYFPAGQNSRRV